MKMEWVKVVKKLGISAAALAAFFILPIIVGYYPDIYMSKRLDIWSDIYSEWLLGVAIIVATFVVACIALYWYEWLTGE